MVISRSDVFESDARMRLCYFGEARSVHLQRWTSWFGRRGHEVHLLSLSEGTIPDVRVHPLPFAGRSLWAFPWKARAVRRLVARIRPDLVHAHQAVGHGLWGALSGHHPFVVSAWGSDVLLRPREEWIQGRVVRYVLRRADYVIPVAEHLQEHMIAFGLRRERSEVIPMGVDFDLFPPAAFQPGTRPLRFVSTRNLEPLYDIETLVRASREIFARDAEIEGRILGHGSRRDPLEALARQLGVTERLHFDGSKCPPEVMDLLAEARIYVSTSTSDGASVSLFEAMARGCFPVVTDIPANRAWIQHGRNGFLFPVGDAGALAARVIEAIRDEPLLEEASRQNLGIVRESGDLGANLRRVESIYKRLLGGQEV